MVTRNIGRADHIQVSALATASVPSASDGFTAAQNFVEYEETRSAGSPLHEPRRRQTDYQAETKIKTKVERPKLHKVILVNDDFTPREFVVRVLQAEFRMTEDQAHKVMITAHQRGVCVVAVFTKRRRRNQGDPRHRRRPRQGLSAAVHHRAGRVAGCYLHPLPASSGAREARLTPVARQCSKTTAQHLSRHPEARALASLERHILEAASASRLAQVGEHLWMTTQNLWSASDDNGESGLTRPPPFRPTSPKTCSRRSNPAIGNSPRSCQRRSRRSRRNRPMPPRCG